MDELEKKLRFRSGSAQNRPQQHGLPVAVMGPGV
jgi:hypothetical protein